MKVSRGARITRLGVLLLVIDQVIKILVKTNMAIGESIHVCGNWFQLLFIENNGMAYGMEIGSKIALSLFRIVAICWLTWYIIRQVRQDAKTGYIVCMVMVLAGAAGNLIDCMFYGLIFNGASESYVSYFVPFGQGYAPFLMGKVVDMFYFPLIVTHYPSWVPVWGGQEFIFFSPVFNFADASISVGVALLLLFYREELSKITLRQESKTPVE